MPSPKRVLILGGGHAGIQAARELVARGRTEDAVEIAIASRDNAELWHGLMPQVLSNSIQPQHVLVPLREVLTGLGAYIYSIKSVDLKHRRVSLTRGEEGDEVVLDYDYLVIAVGSVADMSRFPGLREQGLQTKTLGDFLHLRNHLIDMLDAAAVERDPEERARKLTFVVVGTGFAGVEIVSEANGFIRDSLRYYPGLSASELRFVAIDILPRVLPNWDEQLSEVAAQQMRRRGIELRLGLGLESASASEVVLSNGERIPTRTVIATSGVAPNPLLQTLPVEFVRGRIRCDQYCRVIGRPGVYAAGDAAAVPSASDGQPFPQMVPYALSEGRCAARNILAEIRGTRLEPYDIGRQPEVAILSRGYGVAQVGGLRLSGLLAALVGRFMFLSYMPNWRRRFLLLVDWVTSALVRRDITQLPLGRSQGMLPMRFSAGQTIVREGDAGSRFYIVTEGEVEVLHGSGSGGQVIRRLGPGEWFGELALLQESRRSATVRHGTRCVSTRARSNSRSKTTAAASTGRP